MRTDVPSAQYLKADCEEEHLWFLSMCPWYLCMLASHSSTGMSLKTDSVELLQFHVSSYSADLGMAVKHRLLPLF